MVAEDDLVALLPVWNTLKKVVLNSSLSFLLLVKVSRVWLSTACWWK